MFDTAWSGSIFNIALSAKVSLKGLFTRIYQGHVLFPKEIPVYSLVLLSERSAWVIVTLPALSGLAQKLVLL